MDSIPEIPAATPVQSPPPAAPSHKRFPFLLLLPVIVLPVLSAFIAYLFAQNMGLRQQLIQLQRSPNIFCGGIAGTLCPSGYTCTLEGNYPDASGVCTVMQNTGILKATIMRSPTCPGAQRPGETCEAPVANETFIIFLVSGLDNTDYKTKQEKRSSTVGLIKKQTVTTNAAGQFTVTLEAGSYTIRNTDPGIGKDVGNSDFTIVAGQTTTRRFIIDTGIR